MKTPIVFEIEDSHLHYPLGSAGDSAPARRLRQAANEVKAQIERYGSSRQQLFWLACNLQERVNMLREHLNRREA